MKRKQIYSNPNWKKSKINKQKKIFHFYAEREYTRVCLFTPKKDFQSHCLKHGKQIKIMPKSSLGTIIRRIPTCLMWDSEKFLQQIISRIAFYRMCAP